MLSYTEREMMRRAPESLSGGSAPGVPTPLLLATRCTHLARNTVDLKRWALCGHPLFLRTFRPKLTWRESSVLRCRHTVDSRIISLEIWRRSSGLNFAIASPGSRDSQSGPQSSGIRRLSLKLCRLKLVELAVVGTIRPLLEIISGLTPASSR